MIFINKAAATKAFEGADYGCELWQQDRGPRTRDKEGDNRVRKPRVDGRGFGRQVVNHVLPVFPDAVRVVQSLAVEGEADPIGSVADVEVLGPHPSDNSDRPHLHTIVVIGEQRGALRRFDIDSAEHRRQCLPHGCIE